MGLVGSTVAKVDNGIIVVDVFKSVLAHFFVAPSTSLLLDGKVPGQFAPALQNQRRKRDLVRKEKQKAYPAGMGVTGKSSYLFSSTRSLIFLPGAYQLYRDDLDKPFHERYIHRFQNTSDGGLIIFTCFTELLALLDDSGVKAFEDDTTFKRIEGDLNEWEVVIFYNAVERGKSSFLYLIHSPTFFQPLPLRGRILIVRIPSSLSFSSTFFAKSRLRQLAATLALRASCRTVIFSL